MALVGRFFRAADEVGYGVEVDDGELTGTPADDDGPYYNIHYILYVFIEESHFKYRPGVDATDFAWLARRLTGDGAAADTIAAAGLM